MPEVCNTWEGCGASTVTARQRFIGDLSLHCIFGAQLINLLKQRFGALDCLPAQTDLLDEEFSPGADHVVSLLAWSVVHLNNPLLPNS